MRAQYKINFDRPLCFKKLPEALIIFPELRHLYIQTDRHKFPNRNLDRLYITRPKRLGTSKRRHAILVLHVKNSVLHSTNNSTNVFNDSLPEHPFVACLIDGVPVNAFSDTGSMKSFISDKVHNIFDLDLRISRSHSVVPQLLEGT
jgi:hypothetical protein